MTLDIYEINKEKVYISSLFFWYVPLETMMVGDLLLVVQLYDGIQYHLNEWIQLGEYQPNIYHPHIRGGWQFCHYAANDVIDIIDCMAISHLIKRVVVTRRIDKFTVTAASK